MLNGVSLPTVLPTPSLSLPQLGFTPSLSISPVPRCPIPTPALQMRPSSRSLPEQCNSGLKPFTILTKLPQEVMQVLLIPLFVRTLGPFWGRVSGARVGTAVVLM